MRNILKAFLVGILVLPTVAFATPVSWDFAGSILQPLQSAWSAVIKGSYFQATSTTASIFPYASTTGISFTNASGTRATSTSLYANSGKIDTLTIGTLSGLLKGTSGLVSTASNGTDYTLITGTTCGGTDKVSAVLADGTVTCTADQTGGGGGTQDWFKNPTLDAISPSTTVGLVINASSTITGTFNAGGYGNTLQSGITSPAAYINASTTGRSGVLFQNYGTGTAPEFRFTIGDPYANSGLEYLSLGLTNQGATAGGALNGLQKTDLAYIISNIGRDLLIGQGGGNLYLSGSILSGMPVFKIDSATNRIGINIATTTTPTSTLSVNGDIFTANITATGTASSTYASTSALTIYQAFNLPYLSDGCLRTTSGVVSSASCASGGGGSISTSSIPVAGNLTYWTSPSTVSDVATGTLTETVTGLQFDQTRGLVGGSAVLSLTDGYTVPTTSSTTEWGRAYSSSTALNATSPITYTGTTGNISIQVANGSQNGYLSSIDWTSFNNKVSSSSIDTSFELAALLTDEIGTGQLVFNNPSTFSFGSATSSGSSTIASLTVTNGTSTNSSSTNLFASSLRFTNASGTNASTSNLAVGNSITLFGSSATSYNALCILLTGTAGLCDGNDATGGGSALKAHSWYVDADGAGDYTTIQGALDQCAVVGGGSIYLTDPYYFIGGTGLVFKSNDCQVIGIYASTTIEVSGATTAFKTNSAASTYANVGIQNVVIVGDGTAGSVGIDMSDMIRARYTGIIMDNLDIGFKLDDTQNVTFYNTVRDFVVTTMGAYGIYASSTNPTNDNKFSDGFIGCTAGCTGIHLNNAQANSFTNVSIEPATQSGTIGVKIDVSNSGTNNGTFANKFTNLYAEANGVGIAASSTIGTKIVLANTFDGGEIVANGVDVVDSSSGNGAVQFNGAIVNYAIANQFATTTMTFATTSKLSVGGSDIFTDLTGFGLAVSSGALGLDTTGAADGECLTYASAGPSINWTSCGGAGGSKWTDGTNFTYLTNTTYDLALGSSATETAPFWWDVSATTSYIGNGGTGDSVITFGPTGTEWTMGFDDTDDSFRIASSTSLGTFDFIVLQSTTTLLEENGAAQPSNGMRIGIGTETYYGIPILDQVVINGRMRNNDWNILDCPVPVGATQIAADGSTLCNGYYFGEQTTVTLTAVAGNGYTYGQLGGAAANDGASVMVGSAAAGFLGLATSTPSMEVTARIGTIVANSSTTAYVIGFSSAPNNAPAATEPATGCFFIASSTKANWQATCRTALGTGTVVDTGISSTSITTGAGQWRTFRIDADSNDARFYIAQGASGNYSLVADINTTYPTTQALNAGISFHRGLGTQAIQFDFFGLNTQWRKFTPNL